MVKAGRFFCFGSSSALILGLAHALDALFHFAHAGQILVQLGFVGGADLRLSVSARSLTRSRMLMLRRLPRFSNRLSKASDG